MQGPEYSPDGNFLAVIARTGHLLLYAKKDRCIGLRFQCFSHFVSDVTSESDIKCEGRSFTKCISSFGYAKKEKEMTVSQPYRTYATIPLVIRPQTKRGITKFYFSPKGTYLCTYEFYNPTERQNNVMVHRTATGELVSTNILKKWGEWPC